MNRINDTVILSRIKKKFDYYEEIINTIYGEFDDYDIDCDGYISSYDISNYFKNVLKVNISDETVNNMISEMDSDMNNKICFYEYCFIKYQSKK
jgi:Ca2+-binding EF-hand superfamily protein